MIRSKRVYDPRETSDGVRILVMRYWPRGIRKEHVDEWARDVAPSAEILRRFKHERLGWPEYEALYRAEMGKARKAVDELRRRSASEALTLLCGCADAARCHRTTLTSILEATRKGGA